MSWERDSDREENTDHQFLREGSNERPTSRPLSDKLNDPERMYKHVALGLMLVSGSDLNGMDRQVGDAESELSVEDKLLLRANWKLVKARLESEGYV